MAASEASAVPQQKKRHSRRRHKVAFGCSHDEASPPRLQQAPSLSTARWPRGENIGAVRAPSVTPREAKARNPFSEVRRLPCVWVMDNPHLRIIPIASAPARPRPGGQRIGIMLRLPNPQRIVLRVPPSAVCSHHASHQTQTRFVQTRFVALSFSSAISQEFHCWPWLAEVSPKDFSYFFCRSSWPRAFSIAFSKPTL